MQRQEQTLTLQTDHVPSLVWLGEMRLVEGRPEAAEAPLLRALALQPRVAASRKAEALDARGLALPC